MNVVYTFNDLSRFAVGYDNGETQVVDIRYEAAVSEKNAICSGCEVRSVFRCKSGVTAVNESHINANTMVTGHRDCVVRIWSMADQQLLKSISANKSPIVQTIVIENPFASNLDENYHVISFGETDADVYFNQPKLNRTYQLNNPISISFKDSVHRNPKIQLYKLKTDDYSDTVRIVTFKNVAGMPSQLVFLDIK